MRKVGFQTQVLVIISLFLFLLNFAFGWSMVNHAKFALRKQIEERMLDITNTAASVIDGDMYEKISASNAHSPEYRHVLSVLSSFASHSTLDYVYGLRQTWDNEFIFTIDPALSNATPFGEKAVVTDALLKASIGISGVCSEPYTDAYGKFYTAYSPIYNSGGNIVGIIAADIDAGWYDAQMNHIIAVTLCLFIVSMFFGAGIVYLFTRRLQNRFKELNVQMHELAIDVNSFTQKVIGSNEKPIEKKDVSESLLNLEKQSYDEIHELGNQIREMRRDLLKHIDEIYFLAFRDPMTGVKSKQAWIEYERMEDHMIQEHSIGEFAVAVCDINGLKEVNDKKGHNAGDLLIKEACSFICNVFAHSPVFRIGGDEFAVVLKGQDFMNRENLYNTFVETIKQNKQNNKVVVAIGMSDFDKNDWKLQDTFDRADSLMYRNKKELKTERVL